MIREHADAVVAMLQAAPGTTPLVVYDGVVPSAATPPYVVVYFADADPEGADNRSLTARSDRYVVDVYCHSVGGTAAAARAVGDRVRGVLLDQAPVVAGRQCWPIRREDGQPPQRDESTGTLVMDRVDLYRLESVSG